MNRRAVVFFALGICFLLLFYEEVIGELHGGDMCWLGNGSPFNGQPCPKNYSPDPVMMFFANLWIFLSYFTANMKWGIPLFYAMMIGTFLLSMVFFGLARRPITSGGEQNIATNANANGDPITKKEKIVSIAIGIMWGSIVGIAAVFYGVSHLSLPVSLLSLGALIVVTKANPFASKSLLAVIIMFMLLAVIVVGFGYFEFLLLTIQ